MESFNLNSLKKMFGKMDEESMLRYSAYAIFTLTLLYIFYKGQLTTIGLALGVAMILFSITHSIEISLIAGALSGLIALHYSRRRAEGFEDAVETEETVEEEEGMTNDAEEKKKEGFEESMPEAEEEEGFEDETEEDTEEGFVGYADAPNYGSFDGQANESLLEGFANPKKAAPKKRKAKAAPPNNGERAEFFQIGKKYKMPSENDDKEYHLDAGTTFLNAYKSMKPDQIAAMTKDTQELLQTQKQLMSTLSTLKPLIQDGKQMMDMFQGYFGSGSPSAN
jgi:hypothetical protein